ncbi:hypothetical protein SKAU_G00090960 [Synaphobranchus kaupii]|uniref:Uncharacterized protein n=1 Tax=Synaphobranchus kaupii TaxID=118154 RepID=A0A9Q1FWH9_SYNKA|nr:hypothetical protein SKAU_G00090960 [Synaphobranchus kaupii]
MYPAASVPQKALEAVPRCSSGEGRPSGARWRRFTTDRVARESTGAPARLWFRRGGGEDFHKEEGWWADSQPSASVSDRRKCGPAASLNLTAGYVTQRGGGVRLPTRQGVRAWRLHGVWEAAHRWIWRPSQGEVAADGRLSRTSVPPSPSCLRRPRQLPPGISMTKRSSRPVTLAVPEEEVLLQLDICEPSPAGPQATPEPARAGGGGVWMIPKEHCARMSRRRTALKSERKPSSVPELHPGVKEQRLTVA